MSSAENGECGNCNGWLSASTHWRWWLDAWEIFRTFAVDGNIYMLPATFSSCRGRHGRRAAARSGHCQRPMTTCKCSHWHVNVPSDLRRRRQTFSVALGGDVSHFSNYQCPILAAASGSMQAWLGFADVCKTGFILQSAMALHVCL